MNEILSDDALGHVARRFNLFGDNLLVAFREIERLVVAQAVQNPCPFVPVSLDEAASKLAWSEYKNRADILDKFERDGT